MKPASAIYRIGFGLCLAAWSPTPAWEIVQTGTTATLRSLQFVGPDTGYVTGDSGVVLRTVNGGNSWIRMPSPAATANLRLTRFSSSLHGWTVVGGDSLFKTNDAGQTWIFSAWMVSDLKDLFFTDANRGWSIFFEDDTTKVIRTLNGGATWSIVAKFAEAPRDSMTFFHAIFFSDSTTGYLFRGGAVTDLHLPAQTPYPPGNRYSVIQKTTNGGLSWVVQDSADKTPIKTVFGSKDTMQAIGAFRTYFQTCTVGPGGCPVTLRSQNPRFVSTVNGGSAWSERTNPLSTGFLPNAVSWKTGFGYVVGRADCCFENIYTTANDGVTWTKQSSLSDDSLHAVHIVTTSLAFAAGNGGRLLWSGSLPLTVQNRTVPHPSVKLESGTLRYHLPYVAEVSVTLRDLRGKSLWHHKTVEAPGKRSQILPLQSLPPGSYVLEFRAGGLRESLRVLKEP